MQKTLLILGLFLASNCVQAANIDYAKEGFPPLQPPITPIQTPQYHQHQKTQATNFSKLNKLEKKVFNRTYADDLAENRIARLEEQVFGTIQSGNLNNRYLVLQKAVPRYVSQSYNSDFSPACGIPINNGWRGLAGSLGNFFNMGYMGYPTGMSPQINMPNFNYSTPDFQRANFSNRSWNIHNQNMGAGSKVQILD